MAYELRVAGELEKRFETSEEATAHARSLLLQDADKSVEIIDLSTGKPYAPGADAADREDMARKIGF